MKNGRGGGEQRLMKKKIKIKVQASMP